MTIKEAIVYCYEVSNDICACDECRKDHLQLAHWLEELLDYRKLYEFQDSFGERYLTPEENKRKLEMYREMSSKVAGYEFVIEED